MLYWVHRNTTSRLDFSPKRFYLSQREARETVVQGGNSDEEQTWNNHLYVEDMNQPTTKKLPQPPDMIHNHHRLSSACALETPAHCARDLFPTNASSVSPSAAFAAACSRASCLSPSRASPLPVPDHAPSVFRPELPCGGRRPS